MSSADRNALLKEFTRASLPVKQRLATRWEQLFGPYHRQTREQQMAQQQIALKDPQYAEDFALYNGMYELYKAADQKLQAKEGATKVGSGLFGGQTSHEDVLKALEALKHDKEGAEHHKPSLSAAKDRHSHSLGKPSGGWAALFAKLRTKQPEHATIKEDDGAGVASSWVSATSVGVVVAMCACVAAFAVVRRRQRQSESAAPRADGYATLV